MFFRVPYYYLFEGEGNSLGKLCRKTAQPWHEFLTRLDERENVAMNLDVNIRHFSEVPKDLAIKRG